MQIIYMSNCGLGMYDFARVKVLVKDAYMKSRENFQSWETPEQVRREVPYRTEQDIYIAFVTIFFGS